MNMASPPGPAALAAAIAPVRERIPVTAEPATEVSAVHTHCPYCALNCGLTLEVENGRIRGKQRWKQSPLTNGALCSKGVTAHEQVHHPERLRLPLLRRGNEFEEVGWDEALDCAADGFLRIAQQHGHDANALLSGGSLTNEKVYLLGKFARLAMRTPHVDYNGRFCMTSAGAAHSMAFGVDRMMTPLAEMENAEVAVVIGANISDAFPVALPKMLDGVRQRGGRVIVVDVRRSRFVRPEDLHLALRPSTDAALLSGLLQQVIVDATIDQDFIDARTTDFDAVARSVAGFTLERVAAETDCDIALLREAATLLGGTRRCMYLHGRGPEQQVGGVSNVLSIINLGLALGHVGRPGAGINMLTGQRNGQGGREWGQRCNQLPAGRSINNQEHRETVAGHWGVTAADLPLEGKTYVEILEAAGRGSIRGLLSICTNMSVSAPDLNQVEKQLGALDHLVVVDPFFSPSARHADVVLPGSTFAEESGTITTIEGRVVRIDQAVDPVAGLDDIDIVQAMAARFDAEAHFSFRSPQGIFEEMRGVSAGGPVDYSGITYERIRDEDGLFWPCPAEDHPGTPQLFTERFHHPDGRAVFHVVTPPTPPAMVDADYPVVLTTGRVLAQFLSGNQTMRIEGQQKKAPHVVLEIHPDLAEALRLRADELVGISSRQGSAEVRWKPNEGLRTDTVFMPYHWQECNTLVAADLDPISKIPGFKYTPVSLRPIGRDPRVHDHVTPPERSRLDPLIPSPSAKE